MPEISMQVEIPDRALFKAAEVCDIVKVQPYVLRSWEAEFPELGVTKSAGVPRVYRRSDVEQVARIKHLLLVEGLTLAGARRKLEIEWTPADELTLRVLGRVVAHTVPLLPERLRYFPIAYEARQLERSRRRLRKVLELRPV